MTLSGRIPSILPPLISPWERIAISPHLQPIGQVFHVLSGPLPQLRPCLVPCSCTTTCSSFSIVSWVLFPYLLGLASSGWTDPPFMRSINVVERFFLSLLVTAESSHVLERDIGLVLLNQSSSPSSAFSKIRRHLFFPSSFFLGHLWFLSVFFPVTFLLAIFYGLLDSSFASLDMCPWHQRLELLQTLFVLKVYIALR